MVAPLCGDIDPEHVVPAIRTVALHARGHVEFEEFIDMLGLGEAL
jgi:hypothetical protein